MLVLDRFSFGIGDRFAHQAAAQLTAFVRLAEPSHVRPRLAGDIVNRILPLTFRWL